MERAYFSSPIGILEIAAEERGLASIRFVEQEGQMPAALSPVLQEALSQIAQYFEGTRREFSFVPLSASASPFISAVWEAARHIPYAETVSYGQLAQLAGHPGAARAVGTAMKENPLCIVIPCHRVVPAGGKDIGHYASGRHRKQWLLEHEKRIIG